MPIVKKISIREKIARDSNPEVKLVCNNSDYVVEFDWDEEWDEHEMKTARFIVNKNFVDVVFTGNTCEIPLLSRTGLVAIGLFAGELHTTTPALVAVKPSVLCASGFPEGYSPYMGLRTWEGLDERIAELEENQIDPDSMVTRQQLADNADVATLLMDIGCISPAMASENAAYTDNNGNVYTF